MCAENTQPEIRLTNWQLADFAMGSVALIWTAEALVRFGIGFELTGLVYGYFSMRFLLTLKKFVSAILRIWPVFLYPGFCFLSVFWSVMPLNSAIAAVQISFTILIGLFLGLQFSLRQLTIMIVIALGLTMVVSLGNFGGRFGNAYSWEGGYLGIYTNKNALGQRGTLLLLTCMFLLVSGSYRVAALMIAAITVYLLSISKSATSIMISALACVSLLGVLVTQKTRVLVPWIMLIAATCFALGVLYIVALDVNLFDEMLAAFGKNATLTGRTILWQHGLDKIAENPLLGKGAMAYWVAPQYAQEVGVLRDLYGTTVAAFHNFIIEILVMLGPMGLFAMAVLLIFSFKGIWSLPPSPERIWAIWVFVTLVILSLLGSSLFRQHEIILLLLVALGAASRREKILSPAEQGVRTR